MKTLKEMQAEVREVNEANGWFDRDRSVDAETALLHSEVSEALEAYREHGLGDVTGAEAGSKPEGVGSEFSDILIRLLDTAERRGMDLSERYVLVQSSIENNGGELRRLQEEAVFEQYISALHFQISRMWDQHLSIDSAEDFVIELLWAAAVFQVDLEREFERKIAFNRTRGYRHGNKRV